MDLFVTLLSASVLLCIPVLLASVGELVNERAGVLNVGLEGVILIGVFTAAFVFQRTNSFALAFLAAFGGGVLCWLILGMLYLWRQTEQIVTGLLFNLFAFGLTATLFSKYGNNAQEVVTLPSTSGRCRIYQSSARSCSSRTSWSTRPWSWWS
jgi:simple sugar transport system permease protein